LLKRDPRLGGVVNREDVILGDSLGGDGDREIGGEKMPTPLSFSSAAGKVYHAASPCAGGRPCIEDDDAIRCRKTRSFWGRATDDVVDSSGATSSGVRCLSFGARKVRAITYAVMS
jgi:hypothetical protein